MKTKSKSKRKSSRRKTSAPKCVNHPRRKAVFGFGDTPRYRCAECFQNEQRRREHFNNAPVDRIMRRVTRLELDKEDFYRTQRDKGQGPRRWMTNHKFKRIITPPF